MSYWLEDNLLDELEASTDEFFGAFRQIAKTIGRVARQVAPIATAIPIAQTQAYLRRRGPDRLCVGGRDRPFRGRVACRI
jgi:hypothetical protein